MGLSKELYIELMEQMEIDHPDYEQEYEEYLRMKEKLNNVKLNEENNETTTSNKNDQQR